MCTASTESEFWHPSHTERLSHLPESSIRITICYNHQFYIVLYAADCRVFAGHSIIDILHCSVKDGMFLILLIRVFIHPS